MPCCSHMFQDNTHPRASTRYTNDLMTCRHQWQAISADTALQSIRSCFAIKVALNRLIALYHNDGDFFSSLVDESVAV